MPTIEQLKQQIAETQAGKELILKELARLRELNKSLKDVDVLASLRAENEKLRSGLGAVVDMIEEIYELKSVENISDQRYKKGRKAYLSTTPDPLYAAAPEMLELLEDISAPRRGTEAENWQVDPRVIQLAARIVDKATFNPAKAKSEHP